MTALQKVLGTVSRAVVPLHTPIGVLGAALLIIQLVRAMLDLASTAQFAGQIWPTLWGFFTSPIGTALSIIAGLALYVWGGHRAQKFVAVATQEPWNPQGLYVGLVHVDMQHLEKDLLIEVAARFFNGTGVTVDVSKVTGWIAYFDSVQMKPEAGVKLPAPQLPDDRGGVSAIAPNR